MARSQARIHTSVWRNRDFTTLPASAQATYWMVLAQADVNMAGVVAYMHDRWASFRGDPHRLDDDLETLERGDFLVIDRDTHEVWIRSFAKNDGALRSPTNRKSMWISWSGVLSPTIRRRFLEQLDDLKVTVKEKDKEVQIGVIDEALKEGWISGGDVSEARTAPPITPPIDPPSDTPSTPHRNRAETDTPPDTPPDGGPRTRLPSSSTSSSTTKGTRARENGADDDQDFPPPPEDPDRPQEPTPARNWDQAWSNVGSYLRAYAAQSADKPDLTDAFDPRTVAAIRAIGGITRIRTADKPDAMKFAFKDAWLAADKAGAR